MGEILAWFELLQENGFTRDAGVKIGKTTGAKRILIVEETPDYENSELARQVSRDRAYPSWHPRGRKTKPDSA